MKKDDNAEVAERLRAWAKQIREDARATPYPTSKEDAGLLERAAELLDKLNG
jgi:hypothetical protein